MHILLIHQAYLGGNEAGGTRHFEFGTYLVEHGHTLSVIASTVSYLTGKAAESSGEMDPGGIQLFRAYAYPALHRSYAHRLFNFISFMISSFITGLKRKEVDLVWGTTPPLFQAFPAWLLAKIRRIPFILEVRDLWPAFAVDMGVLRNPVLIKVAEQAERFLYRQADQLIVNSPAYIKHLVGKGASSAKVSFISNGVDLRYFPEDVDCTDFIQDYGLENKFIVLYAGAHGPANDLETVLTAAERLESDSEIVFVLVGDGKLKPALIRRVEERGMKNVRFIPPQPKIKMAQVLAAADVCLAVLKDIPMFKTTYPNKVFDYMAAGKPTLLMIDGVIREVIENAEGGIYIPPGNAEALADAVKLIEAQPETRKQMGQSARSYVAEHFNRSDQAANLENLFAETLQRK